MDATLKLITARHEEPRSGPCADLLAPVPHGVMLRGLVFRLPMLRRLLVDASFSPETVTKPLAGMVKLRLSFVELFGSVAEWVNFQ